MSDAICMECGDYYQQCRCKHSGVPMTPTAGQRCVWTYNEDPDYYETGCGHAYCLTAGTLKENGHRFCPYCGKEIQEAHP